jgi:hypothetical protein
MNLKQVKRKSKLPVLKILKDANCDKIFKKWENLKRVSSG